MKLLVVDDSALMRRLLATVFQAEPDIELAFARDGLEAIEQVHAFRPDVVTLDIHMPHMDGLACLDRIMLERPCRVLMLSSLTEAGADVTLEAMQLGAIDFVAKPAGAISLAIGEFGPALIRKVREVAHARLPRTLRLAERVRHRVARAIPPPSAPAVPRPSPLATQTPRPLCRAATNSTVLVGTSTGGPPALDALLSPLPAGFPWPILVAQHMPATFTGPLARRLDRICALEVVEVTQPMPLAPGRVYVGRGDADLIVAMRPAGPVAMPAPASPDHRWHPSVDRLVASAMAHLDLTRLIGVLMTGMGNDGAASMTRLHTAGGRTIAEAEETAAVWGMPGELIKAGGAGRVVPLDAIARNLLAWAT